MFDNLQALMNWKFSFGICSVSHMCPFICYGVEIADCLCTVSWLRLGLVYK